MLHFNLESAITAMANYNKVISVRSEAEYYQWFNVNYDELFNNISTTDYNAELSNIGQKIQDFYESSDEEIKEKQREEFDKKVLSLKQQEIDYYPDAEKIALHYNRSAVSSIIN